MAQCINVLSIDGGGIRGIIPALVLGEIERRTGLPASRLFHLIVGNSTGGVLVLGLAAPGSDGAPAYAAVDLAHVLATEGERIFSTSLWRTLHGIGGLTTEKYSTSGLETVLQQFLGDRRLSEALTDTVTACYDIERRALFSFRSRVARADPDQDYRMVDVARATAAVPVFFEPSLVRAPGNAAYTLIDGALYSVNPAVSAYTEALATFPQLSDILVVSLGAGKFTRPYRYEEARRWGLAQWALPLISIVTDGSAEIGDQQMRALLPQAPDGPRYYRFQGTLHQASETIDDCSPENLRRLRRSADEVIAASARTLDEVSAVLVARLREDA